MNMFQLCKLQDGEKVICSSLPAFTNGKIYEVKATSVGRLIIDDNNVGQFLTDIKKFFHLIPDENPEERRNIRNMEKTAAELREEYCYKCEHPDKCRFCRIADLLQSKGQSFWE